MLLESQMDYRFVLNNDYSGLDAVIFPSGVVLDEKGLRALNDFIAGGGKVLLIERALLKDGKFQIDIGANYKGATTADCDYIKPTEKLLAYEELPKTPFLSYIPSLIIENKDAEVCAEIYHPLFNRTYGHYCGHKNTPYEKAAGSYKKRQCRIYFSQYTENIQRQRIGIPQTIFYRRT